MNIRAAHASSPESFHWRDKSLSGPERSRQGGGLWLWQVERPETELAGAGETGRGRHDGLRACNIPRHNLRMRRRSNTRASNASSRARFFRQSLLAPKKLFLVPEERQRYQRDRDDPQHDVFAAILFLSHTKKYSTPALTVQVPRRILTTHQGSSGFAAASRLGADEASAPTRSASIVQCLDAEVARSAAQLFFDAQQLVVFCDAVGAGGGAGFDLSRAGGDC